MAAVVAAAVTVAVVVVAVVRVAMAVVAVVEVAVVVVAVVAPAGFAAFRPSIASRRAPRTSMGSPSPDRRNEIMARYRLMT